MVIFLRKTSQTSVNNRKEKKKNFLAQHDPHLKGFETALQNLIICSRPQIEHLRFSMFSFTAILPNTSCLTHSKFSINLWTEIDLESDSTLI